MKIQRISDLRPNQIVLSGKYLDRFEISEPIELCVGANKRRVNLQFSDEIDEDTIGLPEVCVKKDLSLPNVPYDIYIEGNCIFIGPVIGILASKKRVFSQKVLDNYRKYLSHYSSIKGLVFLFSELGINVRTKTIKGFFYNPYEESWNQGDFPFPSVIYRRIKSNESRIDNRLIAPNVFNPYMFNKWDLWQCLVSLRDHLPHTVLLKDLSSLKMMLEFHNEVYLKPINGALGLGIYKVIKRPEGYLFINRNKNETLIQNAKKVALILSSLKKKAPYIIQHSVPLVHKEKNVDFRVIMQKDAACLWNCTGILARYGDKGSIYTNDFTKLALGKDALENIFQLSGDKAREKENEIKSICTRACNTIDRAYGDYGDVGIDVVVDANQKIWILEINLNQQHTLAKYLQDDLYLYRKIVSKPLEYAKSLAGFTIHKNYLDE